MQKKRERTRGDKVILSSENHGNGYRDSRSDRNDRMEAGRFLKGLEKPSLWFSPPVFLSLPLGE